MAVRIKSITFDCADPYRLAQFWSQLTGFVEDPDNGNAPDDPEGLLLSPDGSLALLLIAVPESKQVKNRVHLDLVPIERRRDEEVDRVLGLGARVVNDQRRADGAGWVVLTDPEGNEFCIERNDGECAPSVEQLGRAFAAVGDLISKVRPEQWSAPTPCTDWTARQLVDHLIGMNRAFAALLADEPSPLGRLPTTPKRTPWAPMAIRRRRWRPRSASLGSSNAAITVRWGRPPGSSDCRFVSTICSPTVGTSPRPSGNPPSCLMIWPSSRWPSPAPS